MISPSTCCRLLIEDDPRPLNELPEGKGIYALADHLGVLRYIGITADDTFRKRINSRHVTGSEGNSHKFACAYNVGRMWYGKGCNEQAPQDARLARQLRQRFIRRHCKAVCVPLQIAKVELVALEASVIKIAPPEMKEWNGKRYGAEPEPREWVDLIMADIGWAWDEREAVERQAALYKRHAAKS